MVVIEAETVVTLLHQMDILNLANTNWVRDTTGRGGYDSSQKKWMHLLHSSNVSPNFDL